jgi:phosphatidylglycerophosphate synthase
MRANFDRWLMERPFQGPVLLLGRCGVRPNAVTAAGLALGVAIPVLHQARRFGWVAAAMIVRQLLDCLDGEIARRFRIESRAGAVLDSVSDGVFFFALVWLAVARFSPRVAVDLALTAGALAVLAAIHIAFCGLAALTDHSVKTYDTPSLYRKSYAFLVTNSMLFVPALAGLYLRFPE